MAKEGYKDLIIIGGGAGGLTVASGCAQLGLDVLLIEKEEKLGGDCLHFGCVPSKALIASAKVAHTMRQAKNFGIEPVDVNISFDKVQNRIFDIIDVIQKVDDPDRFRALGAKVVFGHARFVDKNSISIDNSNVVQAKKIVIATGSFPVVPAIEGIYDIGFYTNETIFKIRSLPKKLIVLGGGVIGVELAQAFSRLGSRVLIIERSPRILLRGDEEVSYSIQNVLEQEGVSILTKTNVLRARKEGKHSIITCSDADGKSFDVDGDAVLVAIGHKPNVAELNLEAARVKYDINGVHVNKRMQSSVKHIYAIGDAANCPYKFTHMAEHHAGVAISNIAFSYRQKASYKVVPAVIYTDPEIAQVGETESSAREKKIKFETLRFEFHEIDRAITDSATNGFMKALVKDSKIIGATIFGPHAGEILAEVALAMQANLSISDISRTIHAYPTLAQMNRRVVNTYYGKRLFSAGVKRLVSWIQKIF